MVEDGGGGQLPAEQAAEFGAEGHGLPGVEAERGERARDVHGGDRKTQPVRDTGAQPPLQGGRGVGRVPRLAAEGALLARGGRRLDAGAVRHAGRGVRLRCAGPTAGLLAEAELDEPAGVRAYEQFADGDPDAEPRLKGAYGVQEPGVVESEFGQRPGTVRVGCGELPPGALGEGQGHRVGHPGSAVGGWQTGEAQRVPVHGPGFQVGRGHHTRRHDRQLQREQRGPGALALDLAAGGLRYGGVPDQGDGVRRDLVLLGEGGAQRGQYGTGILGAGTAQLLDQGELFAVRGGNPEGRPAAGPYGLAGTFGGEFDVVRGEVAPLHDHDVLEAVS